MTSEKLRSSLLDRSLCCSSIKRFSLPRLAGLVLLFSPLATCARIQPARDVRPLITSLSSITHKTGVIGHISQGMIDPRATDCQPP